MQVTFKEMWKQQFPPKIVIPAGIFLAGIVAYGLFSTINTGTIAIIAPVPGMQVYIDNINDGMSRSSGEKMIFRYGEGKHSIVVSRTGFWPWTQNVSIQARKTVEVKPFLVRQGLSPSEIPPTSFDGKKTVRNPEYAEALSKFATLETDPAVRSLAEAASIKEARYAAFFPDRTDVLIVAAVNRIFAIDVANTDPRNYEPVYEGNEPTFILQAGGTMLIRDGQTIFRVTDIGA